MSYYENAACTDFRLRTHNHTTTNHIYMMVLPLLLHATDPTMSSKGFHYDTDNSIK
jgi:hypothetical protein